MDPGRGLFVSSSWAPELVPPVLMVVALIVGWHLAASLNVYSSVRMLTGNEESGISSSPWQMTF